MPQLHSEHKLYPTIQVIIRQKMDTLAMEVIIKLPKAHEMTLEISPIEVSLY